MFDKKYFIISVKMFRPIHGISTEQLLRRFFLLHMCHLNMSIRLFNFKCNCRNILILSL